MNRTVVFWANGGYTTLLLNDEELASLLRRWKFGLNFTFMPEANKTLHLKARHISMIDVSLDTNIPISIGGIV